MKLSSNVESLLKTTRMRTYREIDGSTAGDYPAPFVTEHEGAFGDMEWHITTHYELPEYYKEPGIRWPVYGVGSSISKGQAICGYSRMQGIRQCDTVYKTSVSAGVHQRLVAMKGNFMVDGDSGGPWSYVFTAYGIVRGNKKICDHWWQITSRCPRRALWTRASYFNAGMGVDVLTL